jgi:hypothetical protein
VSDDLQRLERTYRRMMRTYPSAYLADRGDDIVATYLDTASPGRRRPGVGDTVDVIVGGLRERLRVLGGNGLLDGAHIAAVLALSTATALVTRWLLQIELPGSPQPCCTSFGPFATIGVVLCLAWLATAVTFAVRPGRAARAAVAVTAALVVLVALVSPAAGPYDQPGPSMLLGHAALSFTTLALPHYPGLLARLTPVAAGVLTAVLVVASGDVRHPWGSAHWGVSRDESVWASMSLAAALLLLAAVVVAVRYARQRDYRGLWALLILLTPVGQLAIHTVYHAAPLYNLVESLRLIEHYVAFPAAVITCATFTAVVLPAGAVLIRRRTTNAGRRTVTAQPAP